MRLLGRNKFLAVFSIVGMCALILSCASRTYKAESAFARNAPEGSGVTAQVLSMKTKKRQIDVVVRVVNETDKSVEFAPPDLALEFAGLRSEASQVFIQVGAGLSFEQAVEFRFVKNLPSAGLAKLSLVPIVAETRVRLHPLLISLPIESR